MILVSCLLLLSLIAYFMTTALHHILLYQRIFLQLSQASSDIKQLDEVTHEIIQSKSQQGDCILQHLDENEVIKALVLGQGCEINFKHKSYAYAWLDFGVFPCLTIQGKASQHWVLTVMQSEKLFKTVQLRLARASQFMPCVGEDAKEICDGVLSYRRLGRFL